MVDFDFSRFLDEQVLEQDSPLRRGVLAVFFFGLLAATVWANFMVFPLRPTPGEIVPYTIIAPADAEWVDSRELSRLRQSLQPEYQIVEGAMEESLGQLDQLFAEVEAAKQNDRSFEEIFPGLNERFGIDRSMLANLWMMNDEERREVLGQAKEITREWMKPGVEQEQKEHLEPGLDLPLPRRLAYTFIRVNRVPQENPQARLRERATKTVNRGEVIIAEGSRATQQTLDQIEALSGELQEQDFYRTMGGLVLVTLWFVLLAYYGMRYKPDLCGRESVVLIIGLLTVLTLLGSMGVMRVPISYNFYGVSLAPIAFTMVVSIIFDPILALYLALGATTLISLMSGFSFDFTIYTMTGALIPPLMLEPHAERRREVMIGLWAALVNVVLAGVIVLISIQVFEWTAMLMGAASGLVGVMIGLGVAQLTDFLSGVLTPRKLRDLLNESNEFIHSLKLEAPGTYHHSLIMSEMAERAAERLGADQLLCKVGALYHDIGKTKHPRYFSENQHKGEPNPHNSLSPESSVAIIKSHVTDGVEMAEDAGLPDRVIDFIAEHHGTSLIKYFYRKAREEADDPFEVDTDEYRYPGPKPQTVESGIVSLADICEATIRAMQLDDEGEIRKTVHDSIISRLEAGELDECGLRVGQLTEIEDVFVRVLGSVSHGRVKYGGEESYSDAEVPSIPDGGSGPAELDEGEHGGEEEETFYSDV